MQKLKSKANSVPVILQSNVTEISVHGEPLTAPVIRFKISPQSNGKNVRIGAIMI